MSVKDGANYAPESELRPVVEPGEFQFAVAYLDHGHIYGMTNGILSAGGTLTRVFDPDPQRVAAFVARYPQAQAARSFGELLEDDELNLVASAAIPNLRSAVGEQVMRAGKHYFTDKSPFTSLEQLESTHIAVEETGRRYFVYYAERVHNEAAWHAGELISAGEIGDVLQVVTLAPHRLSKNTRPDWFFNKESYGGIITDIGSHQVEQFLTYTGCTDAEVNFARVANFCNPDEPGLEDFGELSLEGDTGASFYSRVDWFTPEGMPVWGDGRTFVVGTKGTIEVRKYIDLSKRDPASLVIKVDGDQVQNIDCMNRIGFPFFGQLILDVLEGTEQAMTQEHIFKAAELSMRAQAMADSRNRS